MVYSKARARSIKVLQASPNLVNLRPSQQIKDSIIKSYLILLQNSRDNELKEKKEKKKNKCTTPKHVGVCGKPQTKSK